MEVGDQKSVPQLSEFAAEVLFRFRAGPVKFLRWIVDRVSDGRQDRAIGIVSSGQHGPKELHFESPDSVFYQPASYRDMREMFNSLQISQDDVFLDFGSGMGRVLCVAACYPFRAVIGVEVSPELCDIARLNVRRIAGRLRCKDVRVINTNAASFDIPAEASVIFLFNPFGGATLAQVLEKLGASLQQHPREIEVLFYGTVSAARFRQEAWKHDCLKLLSEARLSTGALLLRYRGKSTAKDEPV
ncbi:MAG: methyltransferase domain-containing protein [Acidobacteriota bacterium]|nr:methyltransferase domain-containing protein [Acidobacteriota bacterium]